MPVAIGSRIGPYEILVAVGAGGMGEVYRARDTRLERDVALKVLPAAALGDKTARARLIREARLASKLNHPHICTIYEVGETDGQTHIAMELVEGQTLAERLHSGALRVDDVVRYGQQLASALAHAHARGVVHRDFKSANVVLTPEGQVKVLDFGLAKRLAGEAMADETTMSRQTLTEAGMVAGTLAYMAPEQLRGQPADARSDIWALGVVLYELVAGERPFRGKTAFELSSAILNQPVPSVPGEVPAPLAGVIERCLAKEPGERYQRADEVRAALEAVASGQPVASASPGRRAWTRRPWLAVTQAVAVLLVAGGVAWWALYVSGPRVRPAPPQSRAARVITLAVLPFENASGKPDQEYFSDAQTQEMTAALGRLRPAELLVKARASVMRYRKTDKPPDQIGRELGVEYLLQGTAQAVGDQVRIWAELIKVADQTQLWGERYEREMADIRVLQSDVARKVAAALAVTLQPADQARLAGARKVDPEVYDLYVKGNYLLARFTKADIDTAEQHFQRALAKDPASALAYAGMAEAWLMRRQLGLAPPREAGEKGRAAALKAAALDDSLAAAHLSLAVLFTWTDFDFPAAEREFKRTLDLDPNNSLARALYGQLLLILQRPDEAIPQVDRAVEIDPLDVNVRIQCAFAHNASQRYSEALEQANQALRLQPGHPYAAAAIIYAQHALRRYADAASAAVNFYEWRGRPDVAAAFKKAYAESGYAAAWRQATDVLLAKYGAEPGVAYDAAENCAIAGDRERALGLLERAYAEREPNIVYLGGNPLFAPLRAEPRFKALLRKMGLPE